MKHEKLSNALNEISDSHIAEAAKPKKKVRLSWLGAVAAILVVAILAGMLWRFGSDEPIAPIAPEPVIDAPVDETPHIPSFGKQFLLAEPNYPKMVKYAEFNGGAWWESQNAQYDQPEGYAGGTEEFFRSSMQTILDSGTENLVYSPINVYMALAMLAETSGGNSRQQLLQLLGADSIETLRTQAGHMWNAHYHDDGLSTSVFANSLWLDEQLSYEEDTVNTLADSYYASVYRGDLDSEKMNKALQSWLNEQTRGLLKEQVQGVEMNPYTILALASTVYYNVQWEDDFSEERNTAGIFHAPGGDTEATFMNRILSCGPYYWGEDFGAVALELRDGSRMWLILPEEGHTPTELLESGYALDLVFANAQDYTEQKDILVNLSVPKFDVVSDMDLIPDLKSMGITEVFDETVADFSPLIARENSYIGEINHAARVSINEKGVTAAAYTVIIRDAAAAEIEDKIDFVLDRPFLFVIESRDGIPLFTGIVNEP